MTSKFGNDRLFDSISLRSFLGSVVSEEFVSDVAKKFPNILESFYVIPKPEDLRHSWSTIVEENKNGDINEILNRIIGQLVRANQQGKKGTQNVLSLGYQRIAADSKVTKMRNSLDVEVTHLNSVVTLLRTDEWQEFVRIFGESCLRRLLDHCLLNRSINRSFLQISGPPVHRFLDQKSSTVVIIKRFNIFYNNKRYCDNPLKDLNGMSADQLSNDIFRKLSLSNDSVEAIRPTTINLLANLKRVNFSLAASLFLRELPETAYVYEILEEPVEEVRVGKKRKRGCRAGKRVKQRCNNLSTSDGKKVSLFDTAVNRANSSSYLHDRSVIKAVETFSDKTTKTFGDKFIATICNNSTLDNDLKTQESTQLTLSLTKSSPAGPNNDQKKSKAQRVRERRKWLKLLHQKKVSSINCEQVAPNHDEDEHDGGIATFSALNGNGRTHHIERSFSTSSNNQTSSNHLSHKKSTNQISTLQTKEVWEFSTSKSQVCSYLLAICRRLLPYQDIWGSRHNANLFYKSVHAFVHLGRHETITASQLLHGIRLSEIPFLQSIIGDSTNIMQAFITWVFDCIIVPLIANAFYVTEVEGHGMEVYYFRKDVWQRIINQHMSTLGDHFVAIDASSPSRTTSSPRPTSSVPFDSNNNNFSRTNSGTAATTEQNVEANIGAILPPPSKFIPQQQLPSFVKISVSNGSKDDIKLSQSQRRTSSSLLNATFSTSSTVSAFQRQLLRNDLNASTTAEWSKAVAVSSSLTRTASNMSSSSNANNSTSNNNLRRVGSTSVLPQFPRLRFVPKKRTLRPIVNLRTRNFTNTRYSNNNVVTNKDLYNCLHVFKHIYDHNPQLRGFGAFGNDDIYHEIRGYRQMLLNNQSPDGQEQLPKLYVAAVDLEKCYDHVNTSILYDLIVSILTGSENVGSTNTTTTGFQPSYHHTAHMHGDSHIQKYTVTHKLMSMDRIFSKNVRFVTMNGNIIPFDEAGKEIASNYHNSIIADAVVYSQINAEEILKLLKQHLFSHCLHMPSSLLDSSRQSPYCTQVKGIPQGSILSPILCNLYYGHVERAVFGNKDDIDALGLHHKTMITRLMDDYLIVSTDKNCVEFFLQSALQSYHHYGGRINPLKTKVNFPASLNVNGKPIAINASTNDAYLHWCGMRINCQTLELEPDLSRLLQRPIVSSLRVECVNPGQALKRAVKTFFRSKCHALYVDKNLNSLDTVLKSLYSLFLYLIKCIRQGILFAARLIHTRTERKILRKLRFHGQWESHCDNEDEDNNSNNEHIVRHAVVQKIDRFGVCAITLQQAAYLGWRAFRDVLARQHRKVGMEMVLRAVCRQAQGTSCLIDDDEWLQKASHAMDVARSTLDEMKMIV